MLSNIPNPLLFEILQQELINGMHNYGTDPTISFNVPVGIKNLSSPTATATATVLPYKDPNPKSIPAWAALPSAPGCTKCCDPGHSRSNGSTLGNSLPSRSPAAPQTSLWGSTISTENFAQEEPMEVELHEHNKLHNVSQTNQSTQIQSGHQSGKTGAQLTSQASNATAMHEQKWHITNHF
ncbi:hypothetical protein DSO57_1038040 [Entomophthora muscae]|uniref:Uncharacterized protein n=1 Tax=Entomophthora muscae TaxID=34485 RepID=A0ACC2SCC8_9FUNG|nr:hypothetical protein DSO57_1038040 [Entomophthora muscae]